MTEDTDRDPGRRAAAPRPAWVGEQDGDAPGRPRRERLPRQPVPGRQEDDGLWEHAGWTGLAVALGTFLAAACLPRSWPLWQLSLLGAVVTAVTWWVSLAHTASVPVALYLASWGAVMTGWFTAARLAGPWHELVIFALVLPAAVLIPAGVTVIRRHRDRVKRVTETGRDNANLRECRYWEDLLQRLDVPGVTIRDVIRVDGGKQVHGRLDKAASGRKVAATPDADAARRICVHLRLPKGSVYVEDELPGGSAADFVIHVRTVTGPRLARYLPAENSLLSISRPFALGVLDTGKEWKLRLREVRVFISGIVGSGKALSVDTPIATPSGWTIMGKIRPGDYVFDETGRPCRVLAATEVMHGRPCYEVEFSDGTVITADAQHQWFVDTDASRRSQRAKLDRGEALQDVRVTACTLSGPGCSPSGKIIARGLCANHYESEKRAGRRDQWPLQGGGCNQEHLRKRPEIRTTEQLIPGLRMLRRNGATAGSGVNNYSVRVAAPLQCPEADLLIPPYTLGAWLGDGHSASSRITTADPEILAEIEAEGETVWIVPSTDRDGPKPEIVAQVCLLRDEAATTCSPNGKVVARGLCVNHWSTERRAGRLGQWPARQRDTSTRVRLAAYTVGGLQPRLRTISVLGNKHIPDAYLVASEEQRRALLAGLLDTDGHCTPSGTAEFGSSCERLARDVYRLACSLGYKVSIRDKISRFDGKDCARHWTVSFTPAEKVFRLPRKLTRQVISPRSTAPHRYITAIRPVPSVPVKCIQVDSTSHLYLAGDSCVPTHNSTLLNVLIAQLCRMPDALIFMIDLKGGQEARAWLMPYLLGWTDRPAIDWLATTKEEADVMLGALMEGGKARAESGKYGRKLRPGVQKDGTMAPSVIVICDEQAEVTGHFIREGSISSSSLATKLLRISERFRSVAIDPVAAAVRAVVDVTGNSGIKAMSDVTIGMRVRTFEEARQVFPDNLAAARQLALLKDKGVGIPKVGADLFPPVHFYNITDGEPDDDGHPTEDRITPVVLATADRRPAPEPLLRDAMGEAYAKRWQQPHMKALAEKWCQEAREAGASAVPPSLPAPQAARGGSDGEAFAALVQADPLLSELDTELDGDGPRPGPGLHPARKRMRQLLIARGRMGYASGQLWDQLLSEGHEVARETVCRWLDKDKKSGYVYQTGKPRSRWVWRLPEGAEFEIPGWD